MITALIEKNFYELFDVEFTATDKEIEEAYSRFRRTYDKDSIASHSLFAPEEREAVLKRVDEAYRTLKNPVKRRSYNMELGYPEVLNTGREKDRQDIAFDAEWNYRTNVNKVEFKKPLIVLDEPRSIAAEQYRVLCARLQQITHQSSCKTFAVTSALKGEGKTTTSVNMAYILAHEFKKKVLLIDADMRNPSILSYLEVEKGYSLVDILKGGIDPALPLISLNGGNFTCLPTASVSPNNPSEFLNSPEMKELIASFKNRFDYVIIDAPPVLPVVDMNILAEIVDGVIFVVKADKTPRDLVLKALKSLTTGNVVGLVLNNAKVSLMKYYKYYKY